MPANRAVCLRDDLEYVLIKLKRMANDL
ncbi:hypothetical protein O9992_12290 [Vibrio lentus]|nr:hypothetical protein [Vibrio lentus]